jgi:thiosulfate reductase cytochrome b subunit
LVRILDWKKEFRRWEMDVPRLLGKAIVMIIPTFVGAGAVWHIFHSWLAVCIWIVIMGIVSLGTVFRKDIEDLRAYLPRR